MLFCFQNVKFILEASGSRWENLIDITVYLTNMKSDFSTFNKIYAEYFPDKATQPCRTTVEVNALPTPIAIELNVLLCSNDTIDQLIFSFAPKAIK